MEWVVITMKKQRFDIGFYLSEGAKSIFTHGFMSFAAVCMIVACLLIMGSFSLVALNLNDMLGTLERENEFRAYIDESLTEEEARALKSTLEAIPNVDSVTFITREEARAQFVENREGETAALWDELPDEALRHRYSIHVVDIEQLQSTVAEVEKVPGVAKINAALEVAQGFVIVRNVASAVAIILVVILVVISLFIISNTIKLATFNRREEIAILKMCGATDSFIRWPFIFEGLILGLFGAVAAFFLEWGVYGLIGRAIESSDTIQLITLIPYTQMAPMVLAIFAGTGFVIGVLGSVLAIRKFLQV